MVDAVNGQPDYSSARYKTIYISKKDAKKIFKAMNAAAKATAKGMNAEAKAAAKVIKVETQAVANALKADVKQSAAYDKNGAPQMLIAQDDSAGVGGYVDAYA